MKLRSTKDRRWSYHATAPARDQSRRRAPTRAEARTALIAPIASILEAMAQIGRLKP